jgi:hypothetical protein
VTITANIFWFTCHDRDSRIRRKTTQLGISYPSTSFSSGTVILWSSLSSSPQAAKQWESSFFGNRLLYARGWGMNTHSPVSQQKKNCVVVYGMLDIPVTNPPQRLVLVKLCLTGQPNMHTPANSHLAHSSSLRLTTRMNKLQNYSSREYGYAQSLVCRCTQGSHY